ncbi:hypothetical protein Ancab_035513 [Ancistrocladus abbreviatus]
MERFRKMWWKKFLPCRTTIGAAAIAYGRRLVHQQNTGSSGWRDGKHQQKRMQRPRALDLSGNSSQLAVSREHGGISDLRSPSVVRPFEQLKSAVRWLTDVDKGRTDRSCEG